MFFLKNLTFIPDTLLKLNILRSDTFLKTRIAFKHFVKMYLVLGSEKPI